MACSKSAIDSNKEESQKVARASGKCFFGSPPLREWIWFSVLRLKPQKISNRSRTGLPELAPAQASESGERKCLQKLPDLRMSKVEFLEQATRL